jgi:uncharacterized protein
MEFADHVVVHAPTARVWEFLLDPERVARCFPEVERLERLGPTAVRASVPVRVAFLTLHVVVDVEVVDQSPPERATFRLHATGPGSTVDGRASFTLADAAAEAVADAAPGDVRPAGTDLAWSVDIEPKGMAASIGPDTVQRQAEPVLRRAIDCLRRSVEAA